MDFLEMASDGYLVSGYGSGWQTAHFSFETQKWKRNWIQGAEFCVQTRYAGKTFAVMISDTETKVYTEGGVGVTSNYQTLYSMNLLKSLATLGGASGQYNYSVMYGNSFYIVMENSLELSFRVFKLNMETLDFTLVQTQSLPARLLSGAQQDFYDQAIMDNDNKVAVDEIGNLYVIEKDDQKYSIRKYLVSGGSEVVLKTIDMKEGTSILSIRYFNRKLYAGLLFQELDEKINTNYYQHYLQLVRQK